jgi:hypothetical protein
MSINQSFFPSYGKGIVVSPGVTSASSAVGIDNKSLNITNLSSTVTVYVRVGSSAATVTATTSDFPVLPSQRVVISKDQSHDTVAYIASATGSIHIIPGEGYM